jgi:hypothetical protein
METGVPAIARVELTDEIEQTRGGRFEMRGQPGNLVSQPIHFCDGVSCVDLHGRISFARDATLRLSFRRTFQRPGHAITQPTTIFDMRRSRIEFVAFSGSLR